MASQALEASWASSPSVLRRLSYQIEQDEVAEFSPPPTAFDLAEVRASALSHL